MQKVGNTSKLLHIRSCKQVRNRLLNDEILTKKHNSVIPYKINLEENSFALSQLMVRFQDILPICV
jgi:hypothetical protein